MLKKKQQKDWTQVVLTYKGPLLTINNNNKTYVCNKWTAIWFEKLHFGLFCVSNVKYQPRYRRHAILGNGGNTRKKF